MAKKYKLTQDGPEVQALLNKIDDLNTNNIEETANKSQSVETDKDSTAKYPSTKAVADAITAGKQIFWATYGETTAAEIDQAVADGKAVMCYYGTRLYVFSYWSASYIYLTTSTTTELSYLRVKRSNDSWSQGAVNAENIANKKTTISGNESSDAYYPTTKAVADAISAGKQVFWATYGVTTIAEIQNAVASGKIPLCLYNDIVYVYGYETNYEIMFTCSVGTSARKIRIAKANESWVASTNNIEETANKSQSVETDKDSTNKYPSTKAVWDGLKVRPVMDSTSQETVPSLNLENTANKSQDVQTDRESIAKYPSVKAVFDSLGKWGVISQTQTWTGSGSNPRTYTMSDQVCGMIPQANIDLYTAAGAVFNENTGYFELNGLTDISYQEMMDIYSAPHMIPTGSAWDRRYISRKNLRTNIPYITETAIGSMGTGGAVSMFLSSSIETIVFGYFSKSHTSLAPSIILLGINYMFGGCSRLKSIKRLYMTTTVNSQVLTSAFDGCYSLETIELYRLGKDVSFSVSSQLNLSSIVLMVDNAANTSAITITLHATAYARCQADTTEYTYNGQTYTGIIAYAAAKNITIASA